MNYNIFISLKIDFLQNNNLNLYRNNKNYKDIKFRNYRKTQKSISLNAHFDFNIFRDYRLFMYKK